MPGTIDKYSVGCAVEADIPVIQALDARIVGADSRAAVIAACVMGGNCLIAVCENDIAGFALLHWHFFAQLFVELLMVAPEMRRRGIASALLRECVSCAATGKLFSSTNQSNIAMQRVFLKSGFRVCGYIDNLDEGDPEIVYCRIR